MKYFLTFLTLSLLFSQELEVEGDLKVTGTVESATIDSILGVIANMQAAHQADIDSLQAQIDELANSAVNMGFVETEVFNGTTVKDVWTDIDLSSAVGQKTSLVLLKCVGNPSDNNGVFMWFRANGDTDEFHTAGANVLNGAHMLFYSSVGQNTVLGMYYTDSNGIIEYQATNQMPLVVSVVFYLNQ